MSGAGFRASIPTSVRRTIQNIKEITGNHSEEDIYAMLKECSMDPNETTQKLLLQGIVFFPLFNLRGFDLDLNMCYCVIRVLDFAFSHLGFICFVLILNFYPFLLVRWDGGP